eukprot:345220-Hanusia_phi.AAC.1
MGRFHGGCLGHLKPTSAKDLLTMAPRGEGDEHGEPVEAKRGPSCDDGCEEGEGEKMGWGKKNEREDFQGGGSRNGAIRRARRARRAREYDGR